MKKIFTKEVRTALIVLISLFLLYMGVNHLKGINIFQPANHYYVAMNDVSELQLSSPVYIDGFKVGIVSDIQFNHNSLGNLLVQISLDKNIKLPAGTHSELKSGLTSGAYLSLRLDPERDAYLSVGDTINGIIQPGLMDQLASNLLPQTEQLLPRLDSILRAVQYLLEHPALNQSLLQIEATTAGLQLSAKHLNAMLSNDIPEILVDLKQISSNLATVSDQVAEIEIAKTASSLDQTIINLRQITEQMRDSTNSLGLLLNNPSLYQHLDSTARNASNLLLDLQLNPKRYVHFSLF
jgi:phospholipid/cholesterol/gamma-HCH transport system substrate-binding protein